MTCRQDYQGEPVPEE